MNVEWCQAAANFEPSQHTLLVYESHCRLLSSAPTITISYHPTIAIYYY